MIEDFFSPKPPASPGGCADEHRPTQTTADTEAQIPAWLFAGDRLIEYRMFGRAMQVLYDQAILSGPALKVTVAAAGPVGPSEELKITPAPLTLEERTRVSHSVDRAYRLPVSYEVRVVNMDALDQVTAPAVRERLPEPGEAVST